LFSEKVVEITDVLFFQELFQGKDKDFDVQKALSTNCLRDFDGAISMVSHGFSTVDDFYAENSMRLSVARVKIPVLFIQVKVQNIVNMSSHYISY
jgi:predicted alpha/beta-fold hydrolase